jgi:DNA-binding transcriptional MerR regulator
MIQRMSFTVGQIAKLSGLSVRSLHHYDETGLLCPSERSDAGYRLYSESDIERLHQIQALRWLELPLSEVKEILDRDGATIPEVVDRKIAALTKQIEQETELRTRLISLRTRHLQGDVSGKDRWLSALELFSHYEKHLSADELNRFKSNDSDVDEWRAAYDDVVSALDRNVSPASEEGQALAYRWGVLTFKFTNGDIVTAYKAKAAYENDEGVRRSVTSLTGSDPAVMDFVLAASNHAHRQILAQYFAPEELERLNLKNLWRPEWLRIATALREEHAKQSPIDCKDVQALAVEWSQQLNALTGGDDTLKAKLLNALEVDHGLQKRWLVADGLLRFAQQALSAASQVGKIQ